MKRYETSPLGELVRVEVLDGSTRLTAKAHVPHSLPGVVALTSAGVAQLEQAVLALGRLDGVAQQLPNPWLIARPAIRREALSSSSLEGTVSTMSALLSAELLGSDDSLATREVRNFVNAMERGVALLKDLPISVRLVKELHAILMDGVRGDGARAGEVRTSQNWIGPPGTSIEEAKFVPPPAGDTLTDCLSGWEKWIHEPTGLANLVRVAMAHYQFETIHPFDDGNGRIGRLLVILMLMADGALSVPLLDISTWLEARRDEYIDHLRSITETGDFDPWFQFFFRCVAEQSDLAAAKTTSLLTLRDDLVATLRSNGVRGMALEITESLIGYPYLTVRSAADLTGKTYQAANAAVSKLVDHKVLSKVPGNHYPQLYYAPSVFDAINR